MSSIIELKNGELYKDGVIVAFAVQEKQYLIDTPYTNGTPTASITPVEAFTIHGSSLIPYQTSDGAYRLRIQVTLQRAATHTSDVFFFLTGILSKNISSFTQVGVYGEGAGGVYNSGNQNACVIGPNSNAFGLHTTGTSDSYVFFMDLELESKPTWQD